jgi:DNA polymerase/3'-5' exonuclease PolX
LLELTEVPGLGANSVARLYAELGILDLAALEARPRGKVRTLAGFTRSPKREFSPGSPHCIDEPGGIGSGVSYPRDRRLMPN